MDFADCKQWRPRWPTSKNVKGEEFEVVSSDMFVVSTDGGIWERLNRCFERDDRMIPGVGFGVGLRGVNDLVDEFTMDFQTSLSLIKFRMEMPYPRFWGHFSPHSVRQ